MDKTVFIRKDKPAFQMLIISFFVQFIGIILISSAFIWWQMLIGVILLLTGLTVFSLRTETHYEYDSNSLIVIWKVLFVRKSQKEKLPEIDYIAIVRVKTSRNLHYKSITLQESGYKCNLNLIYKNSKKRFHKLCTVEKEKAIQIAKELSEKLDKPILDNSTPDKKWINR